MRRLYHTLISARAGAYLMAAVVILVLLSAIIPQQGFEAGRIKGSGAWIEDLQPVLRLLALDRIYASPLFMVLLGMLALGILAGLVHRLLQLGNMRGAAARIRHLGSIVFHLALVLVLAGAVLNRSFRFEGVFGLTEGQSVVDEPERYVVAGTGNLRGEKSGRFHLRLDSVHPHRPVGEATTEAADVTVSMPSGTVVAAGTVSINHPLRWQTLEFHMGPRVGYSPEVVVMDDSGSVLMRNFVRVGGRVSDSGKVFHEDFIDGPVAGRELHLRVEPDTSGARYPRITLRTTGEGGAEESGVIAVGDTLQLGGARITVPRIRRWCYILVVENPWVWLVFTGFWVGLAGLALSAVARVLPRNGKSNGRPAASSREAGGRPLT